MLICIMFIAHFLADFSFQSTKLSQKKLNTFKYLIRHASIYAVIFLIAIFPFVKLEKAIISYIIIICSHFIIDWIGKLVDNKINKKAILFYSFITDQIIHISILAILYYSLNIGAETTALYVRIRQWTNFNNIVIYSLIFVIIWNPAAFFVNRLLMYITDEDSFALEKNDLSVGRIIGKLERIIISVLILYNQFGAIGFVLTAKSIARFKQLDDRIFAEKYLVGTLTSVLIAFIETIILKQFLK